MRISPKDLMIHRCVKRKFIFGIHNYVFCWHCNHAIRFERMWIVGDMHFCNKCYKDAYDVMKSYKGGTLEDYFSYGLNPYTGEDLPDKWQASMFTKEK